MTNQTDRSERFRVKTYAGFIITIICIAGLLAMAFLKDMDTSMAIVSIAGLYLGARTATAGSAHWASSKDVSSNTDDMISRMNEDC